MDEDDDARHSQGSGRRAHRARTPVPERGAQRAQARHVAVAEGSLRHDRRRHPDVAVLRPVSVRARFGIEQRGVSGSSASLVRHDRASQRKNWYIVHTYSGFEKKVAESLQRARQGVRAAERHRRGPDSDRRRGRDARRQEGRDREAVLPRLHPGRDEHVRPRVARGEEHAEGHRLCRRRRQADAAQQGRSRSDPDAGEDGGREAEAEVHVRKGRAGADQRRAVHQLQRRGRRGQPRQEHAEGDGDDLRPRRRRSNSISCRWRRFTERTVVVRP